MSDELEKFVLEYDVKLGQSIDRLEELTEKFENAEKKGKESVGSLKKVFAEIGGEMKDLVPQADKAFSAVARMGKAAPLVVALAVAVVSLVKGMKALNAEYQIQRQIGFQVGMNPAMVEDYQRQFNSANGRMTRGQSRDLLQKVSSKVMEAYVDPNPWNRQAIALQQSGAKFSNFGAISQTDEVIDALTKKYKSVSEEQAQALGQSIGLTVDEVRAIRNRNSALAETTKQTDSQLARTYQAMIANEKLNVATGKLAERWDQVSDTVAQDLMPVLETVVTWIEEITQGIPEALDKGYASMTKFGFVMSEMFKTIMDPSSWGTDIGQYMEDAAKRGVSLAEEQIKRQSELAKDQQRAAERTYQANAMFQKNVNLFAQSVGAFSGVIDDRQAWASWAGQIGKEGGVSGLGEVKPIQAMIDRPIPNGPVTVGGTQDYNFGNIRSSSSGFRGYSTAEEGMSDQIRLLRKYQSEYGRNTIREIISKWAPPEENDTEGYIKFMSHKMGIGANEQLNLQDPKIAGTFAYYQAAMEKGWNKLQGFTPDHFIKAASGGQSLHGESRASAQQQMVMEAIANTIGIPSSQLNMGGASTGDVDFALRQLMFESQNKLAAAQARYDGKDMMLPAAAAQAKIDLMNANQEYNILREFGPAVLNRSRRGGRDRTEGRPDITFHIQVGSVQNAEDFNQKVRPALEEAAAKVSGLYESQVRY